jgi:hypothetical protein
MYIMRYPRPRPVSVNDTHYTHISTLTSQIAMTLGVSKFPGALGSVPIEILPFLRGVATDIRGALGDNHPGLVPTVMAAYALTSVLTRAAFILLGVLKLGNLVRPVPLWLSFYL